MGFYLELRPAENADGSYREFLEQPPPAVFWILYLIAGFALVCMGAAAYSLLGDLVKSGSFWDVLLVAGSLSAVPAYLLIGAKLVSFRKIIRVAPDRVTKASLLFGKLIFPTVILKKDAEKIELLNQRPAPNVAPGQHDDSQYFIRGHWRVGIKLRNGKSFIVDRHTEKEALESLRGELDRWFTDRPA